VQARFSRKSTVTKYSTGFTDNTSVRS